jgi:hypothetical protein
MLYPNLALVQNETASPKPKMNRGGAAGYPVRQPLRADFCAWGASARAPRAIISPGKHVACGHEVDTARLAKATRIDARAQGKAFVAPMTCQNMASWTVCLQS